MTKGQRDILFAAALVAARDLLPTNPLRARLADAMKALLDVVPTGLDFPLTLTADMVRDPRRTLGRDYFKIAECLGRLQRHDIGRRLYLVGGIVQAENDEQRAARLATEQF